MMVECQSFRDGRHGIVQHAVDAVLDYHFGVARLDVNVQGAPLERVEDGGIHQLDDRRNFGILRRQLLNRERLVGVLVVAHHVERETLRDLVQHALRLLGLLQQVGDLRERCHFDLELALQQDRQFVDEVQVPRVGQRDLQQAGARFQRHEVVAEHRINRDALEELVVDLGGFQVHELAAVARRQHPRLLGLALRIHGLDDVGSH